MKDNLNWVFSLFQLYKMREMEGTMNGALDWIVVFVGDILALATCFCQVKSNKFPLRLELGVFRVFISEINTERYKTRIDILNISFWPNHDTFDDKSCLPMPAMVHQIKPHFSFLATLG